MRVDRGPESADGQLLLSGEIRLWTVVRGTGRRVLIVHGGPGLDHNLVAPLADELAVSFEVWTPDLPGHGRSKRDGGKTPGLRQLQDKLSNWIGHLPFRFDAVIGHSLGAWLVRELLRHERIETSAAILISPPAAGQTGAGSALRRAERVTPLSGDPDFHNEIRRHVEAECGGALPDGVADIIARADLTHISRYRALVKNLHQSITSPPRPFVPACPVLVIAGSDDRTTPVEQAYTVASAIEGARVEVLPELGHYPFMQDPAAVAEVVRGFLKASDP